MPRNYNDDNDRYDNHTDNRTSNRTNNRNDEWERSEWQRASRERMDPNFNDRNYGFGSSDMRRTDGRETSSRRQYDPSFHRNYNQEYDRSNYQSDSSRDYNSPSGRSSYGLSDYGVSGPDTGFGGEANRWNNDSATRSFGGDTRGSMYAPADSRDNLNLDSSRRSFAGRGPKGYRRSDERIREDVSDLLERDHHIDASEIEVDVQDSIVTLRGSIHDRLAKRLAEDLAHNCRGVTDVRNELKVDQNFWQQAKDAVMSVFNDQSSTDVSADVSTSKPMKSKH